VRAYTNSDALLVGATAEDALKEQVARDHDPGTANDRKQGGDAPTLSPRANRARIPSGTTMPATSTPPCVARYGAPEEKPNG
jgi:hypothetical protein